MYLNLTENKFFISALSFQEPVLKYKQPEGIWITVCCGKEEDSHNMIEKMYNKLQPIAVCLCIQGIETFSSLFSIIKY